MEKPSQSCDNIPAIDIRTTLYIAGIVSGQSLNCAVFVANADTWHSHVLSRRHQALSSSMTTTVPMCFADEIRIRSASSHDTYR